METTNTRSGRRKPAPKSLMPRNAKNKTRRVIGVKLKGSPSAPRKVNSVQSKTANATASSARPINRKPANLREAKGKVIALPVRTAKVEEIVQTPTTPSAAMLKSFRVAAKQRQQLAKKFVRSKTPGKGFLAIQTKSGKRYALDLRIHTPGTRGYFATAGVETGSALVRLAKVKGIDVIGLTDYYNASFVDAVRASAADSGVTVIPGFDMRCRVGLCPDLPMSVLFSETQGSERIYNVLEMLSIPREMFGCKEYCVPRDFSDVVQIVEQNGGLIIPSRVDKTPHRQSAVPLLIESYGFHAFDLVHPENTTFFSERWPNGGFTFLSFSNANALAQVGSRVAKIRLTSPGFEGIQSLVKRRA